MQQSQDPSSNVRHPHREDLEVVPGAEEPGENAKTEADESTTERKLQMRVASLEQENHKFKEDYIRALAEADNARRMADKRIEDNSKYAVSNFAKALLSVADNLGRALMAAPDQLRESNEALKTLAIGVEMTERELQGTLAKYQVQKIDAKGKPFDPNLHQAVQEVDDASVPTGTIVQVYQDGYTIHDRLLRPAMVVVSRGGPKREATAPQEESASQASAQTNYDSRV